jgi:hypothetical protein
VWAVSSQFFRALAKYIRKDSKLQKEAGSKLFFKIRKDAELLNSSTGNCFCSQVLSEVKAS